MKKIIYTKYSNERAKCYAIRTDILCDEQMQRSVRKSACYPEGERHIQNIASNYQRLSKQFEHTAITMNQCSVCETGVELQYLQGQTLEEQLDALLYAKEYEKVQQVIAIYLNDIRKTGSECEFEMTQSFKAVFGDVVLPAGLKCAPVTNIDMVFANVISSGNWNLIDYEWTFDFPIPIDYVVYRVLHYYMDVSPLRRKMKDWGLFEQFGISLELIKAFEQMEGHFQKHIEEGHVPIRTMYSDISPGKLLLNELINEDKTKKKNYNLQIFFAQDMDFSEQNSSNYKIEDGCVNIVTEIPAGTKQMRLDPGELPGLLSKLKLKFISEEDNQCEYTTNGSCFDQDKILFEEADPQLIFADIPATATALQVSFQMDTASVGVAQTLKTVQQQNEIQRNQIQELESLIHEMEQTKVWKMYRKIKKAD